jgi:Flp pilus assembly protein TadD
MRTSLFLAVILAGHLGAADPDVRFLQGLIERNLFESVEYFCHREFQKPAAAKTNQLYLASELVRSRTKQALLTEHPENIKERLTEIEKQFLTIPDDFADPAVSLARMMLQLQLAISFKQPDASKSELYEAIERFKKCSGDVKTVRQKIGTNAHPELEHRLAALQWSILSQRGLAHQSLALTFPAGEDRAFELQQAVKIFSELAALDSKESIIVQSRIELATCFRLLGNHEKCREILVTLQTALQTLSLTPLLQFQADAELIRYHIATGNIDEAVKQFEKGDPGSAIYPDYDLARLELFLAQKQPDIRSVLAVIQQIEQQSGPYWGQRARQLLTSANPAAGTLDAATLASLAENQYRSEHLAEAVTLLEQASKQSDSEASFQYGRSAISILSTMLEQTKSNNIRNQMIGSIRRLSLRFPQQPESAELHLLALDLAASAAKTDDYLAMIEEHTKTWSDSPKIQLLRRQAVILLERQGRTEEALKMLPQLDTVQIGTMTPEMQRLHARQLEQKGETQGAVDILKVLLKQKPDDLPALQLLAEILGNQNDSKLLDMSLRLWVSLEQKAPKKSELWWSAREGIMDVLLKQGKTEEARKSLELLRLLYPDLGGAERKQQLEKKYLKI